MPSFGTHDVVLHVLSFDVVRGAACRLDTWRQRARLLSHAGYRPLISLRYEAQLPPIYKKRLHLCWLSYPYRPRSARRSCCAPEALRRMAP